ncbi:MAG: ATPase domain-containing protein [Methanocellales archaeon]|nr:ATPase domain-containing protein [Methanocellales archaeon]
MLYLRMEDVNMDDSKRMPTGIEGLDELCGGGLIRNKSYLLSGITGSGKSIFALQFLYNGATKYDESGILVTTEEHPRQVRENALNFGWDLKALEDENKLIIIDACAAKLGIPSQEKYVDIRPFDTRSMIDQVITAQERIDAKRAVIDSTTSIGFYLQDPAKIRVELLRLSSTLKIIGLTSLLTCEIVDEDKISRFGVEGFMTDGVIVVHYKKTGAVRVHSIEVLKMRGSEHSNKTHPLDITSKGVVTHPREEIY